MKVIIEIKGLSKEDAEKTVQGLEISLPMMAAQMGAPKDSVAFRMEEENAEKKT